MCVMWVLTYGIFVAGVCTSVTTAADGADSGTCDKDGLCDGEEISLLHVLDVVTSYIRCMVRERCIPPIQYLVV